MFEERWEMSYKPFSKRASLFCYNRLKQPWVGFWVEWILHWNSHLIPWNSIPRSGPAMCSATTGGKRNTLFIFFYLYYYISSQIPGRVWRLQMILRSPSFSVSLPFVFWGVVTNFSCVSMKAGKRYWQCRERRNLRFGRNLICVSHCHILSPNFPGAVCFWHFQKNMYFATVDEK